MTTAPDTSLSQVAPAHMRAPRSIARSVNDVGWKLFGQTAGDGQDAVLSPVSIGIALGMLDAGATGSVADALHRLFGQGWEGENRVAAFAALSQAIVAEPAQQPDVVDIFDPYFPQAPSPTVRLAHRMYHDVGFVPRSEYVDVLRDGFDAGIERLVMAEDPAGSVRRINEWVSSRTNGLIPDLLNADAISGATRLVLVNALYFKATWLSEFHPDDTEDQPFTLLDGSTCEVPLMHQWQIDAPAMVGDGLRAIELEYAKSDLSMLVVLPDEGNFEDVEARMSSDLVEQIDAALCVQPVDLWLPRFTTKAQLDVGAAIQCGLGIEGLTGSDGLDGIGPDVSIDSIQHAAIIIVDEHSTEAAATTFIGAELGSIPDPVELMPLRADRPFLYAIRERSTGVNLFVGRVVAPHCP